MLDFKIFAITVDLYIISEITLIIADVLRLKSQQSKIIVRTYHCVKGVRIQSYGVILVRIFPHLD